MIEEVTGEQVIVCEICGTYSGSAAQLRGHRMQCKIKSEKPLVMKSPEELQTELDEAKAQIAAMQATQSAPMPEPRKREQPDRTKRVPMGKRGESLGPPNTDKNFHVHIFNDGWRKNPDRVQKALRAGYVPMEGFEPVIVGSNKDGTPIKGIRMQLPIELYEQDQAIKQEVVDARDKGIREGTYGVDPKDRPYITSKATMETRFGPAQPEDQLSDNKESM